MKRSPILPSLWLLLLRAPGCSPFFAIEPQTPISHIVVCWLKTPGDEAARRQLIEESRSFKDIPGVVSVSTGQVFPSDNPAADKSFDVAVVMRFKSAAALANYAKDPKHLAAVERTLKPLVAKYIVYDYTEGPASSSRAGR